MRGGWLAFVLISISTIVPSPKAQETRSLPLGKPLRAIELPEGLEEISGLAVASQNSVFAHDDEFAIVYEISINDGKMISAFALGDPTVDGDFEGVAATDERVYLIASNGLLYEAPIGEHRKRVRYNIYDTGASDFCEIEGLTTGPAAGEFLLLCKSALTHSLDDRLVIYKWSLAERLSVSDPWMSIPYKDFLSGSERKDFRPSAIEWRPKDQSLLILSARNHMAVSLRRDGSYVSKEILPATDHPQAEGLAIMPSGVIVIGDEGGRSKGRLTIYGANP